MPQHGFDKNLIRRIFFFNIQRGDPLDFQKRFLQCRGVIFQKKKFCVFGSLSNMSKNGLRMVVCLNFDITHLSAPSNIIQGVSRQSAKAKLKNRHFTGGYRGSKPFFLTLQTGLKFPVDKRNIKVTYLLDSVWR